MKILVISLAGVGDTIFATPLLHELRLAFPEAAIDALVMWGAAKEVLQGNPHLNDVFQKNLIQSGLLKSVGYLRAVGARGYDISINTHPQSRLHYRIVARLLHAKRRVSHRYDHHSVLDHWLVNCTVPLDYSLHSVENNLRLLSCLNKTPALASHAYELFLKPEEEAWAQAWLAQAGLAGRKLLGVHVGSGGTKNLALRRWPLDAYTALIRELIAAHKDLTVLLFGGPEEQDQNESIVKAANSSQVLRPQTRNIREGAGLIGKCQGFLSVDTALMHVAAAMKVPGQVVIETPTWNKPIEPYAQRFTLVPNPGVAGRNLDYYRYDGAGIKGSPEEIKRCMASVRVDAVRQAVERVLF
jgi:heptosyltransferase II